MKKQFGDYYLGLDIGTDSVGWAVTDLDYNVLEFRRKAMWGIHLFDSGNTAKDRRMHRCSRRRLERRGQRIALLQSLFGKEVSQVDPSFFERLSESRYFIEDRKHKQPNSLFNDPNYQDKDLHKKYPTIYHLRHDLMCTEGKPDIRLVYLAAHHIVKYRGHFLFEGLSNDSSLPDFDSVYEEVKRALEDECGIELVLNSDVSELKTLLTERSLGKTEKTKRIVSLFAEPSEETKTIAKLLAGGTVSLDKIFGESDLDEKLTFEGSEFEEKALEIEDKIGTDRTNVLNLLKQLYDWALLTGFLSGCSSISEAKIQQYDRHKADLKILKSVIKSLDESRGDGKKTLFDTVFKSNTKNNYAHYVGIGKKGRSAVALEKCTQADFCKFLRALFKEKDIPEDKYTNDMMQRITDDSFMPKQTSKDNSIFPNALHRNELKAILDNASKYYEFLNDKDESGISVKEKIVMLCTFRIPYYVGPVSPEAKNKWCVRKEDGAITPWNFKDKIDLDKSSSAFIENLTSKCTYLPWENVVPKNSLLYSRFLLYNELNKMRINGELVDPSVKRDIVNDLFVNVKAPKKVTVKALTEYILSRTGETVEITGIDKDIKTVLKSEVHLRNILGEKINNRRMAEEIIRAITIFGEDASRLKAKLKTDFGDKLSDEEINRLAHLRFTDWGRLSERFLTGIYHTWDGGLRMNLITAMEQTNHNLMELLSKQYSYMDQVEQLKKEYLGESDGKLTHALVDDLYCSPAVKRGIWRTLRIIQDILKITGHPPKKVFVETTREEGEKKSTDSRKTKLLQLFEACKDDERDWAGEIGEIEEGRFRGKKLYLYYTQMGKCMYCGKNIDLNELTNTDIYTLDHIFPQSKITDDSIHNNMVLAHMTCNSEKSNVYPIKEECRIKMHSHWKHLLDCKLITPEKYKRLTRVSPFSDNELSDFIARQIVETSQSVKAVAEVLKSTFGDESDIVYVKANNVSRFRQEYDFVKCRCVNDFHHAKDAYLNIVVGNVYDVKFTKNPLTMVHGSEGYNLNKMYRNDVERNGVRAWKSGDQGTIKTVSKYMTRNNIAYTCSPVTVSGQLFDVTIKKKGVGQHPIKSDLPIEMYGGYNKVLGGTYALVEHKEKKKLVKTIESVPAMINSDANDRQKLTEYFTATGLVEPRVLMSGIKKNTMFEINGYRVTISGRTNNQLLCRCAKQLILPYDIHDYCKELSKFIDQNKETKGRYPVTDYDLNSEMNIRTYDVLLGKLKEEYCALAIMRTQADTLEKLRLNFINATLDVQCIVLGEVLHLFQCNALPMDISAIGGSSHAGISYIPKKIDDFDSIKIITQSPSGMFERSIDLRAI